MSDAVTKKRTWLGLVCPVCRFVFRVPKGHEGHGVICPACNHLLNLPESKKARKLVKQEESEPKPKLTTLLPETQPKKESKPIVARPFSEEDKVGAPAQRRSGASKGRRVKKSSRSSAPAWEQKSTVTRKQSSNAVYWIVGGGVVGLLLAFLAAKMIFDDLADERSGSNTTQTSLPPLPDAELEKEPEIELSSEEKKRQQEIKDSVKTGMNVLSEAENVVSKFLQAESLDEAVKHVRRPDLAEPRMRAWYSDEPWAPTKVKKIGVAGRVTVKGKMASLTVQLEDFTYRQIALERVGDKYKVDWESWVAWSTVPWNKIFELKPQKPIEVRVRATVDSYYNRYFRDDKKWIAVRLEHPREFRALYGYISKDDPALTRMLSEIQSRQGAPVTIEVAFPKESPAKNQVQITRFIQTGWVKVNKDLSENDTTSSPAETQ